MLISGAHYHFCKMREWKGLDRLYEESEDEYIRLIEKHLENGGDINKNLLPCGPFETCDTGTILIHAALNKSEKITKFVLDKDINIGAECLIADYQFIPTEFEDEYRLRNALDVAIFHHSSNASDSQAKNIYEMIKEKSLEKYASYGLHQLHMECGLGNWSEIEKYIHDPGMLNKTIDIESPLWGGCSPLLVATKFNRQEVAIRLIDLGASPKVRDTYAETPLHYLSFYEFCDKRLFIYDEEDTFSRFSGMSHFHIACQFRSLDVVKKYLDQGVDPNLKTKINKEGNSKDNTGLQFAGIVYITHIPSADLAALLLEYGAEVDERYSGGFITSLPFYWKASIDPNMAEYVCILLEAYPDRADAWIDIFSTWIKNTINLSVRLTFLRSVIRIKVLHEDLVTEKLNECANECLEILLEEIDDENEFDAYYYYLCCMKELRQLKGLGLLWELRDLPVMQDFKQNFGTLVGSPTLIENFPIYGRLLKIRLRNRLVKYEKQRRIVNKALPYIIFVFKQLCNLPVVCAEKILWNLNCDELSTFIELFSTNATENF